MGAAVSTTRESRFCEHYIYIILHIVIVSYHIVIVILIMYLQHLSIRLNHNINTNM